MKLPHVLEERNSLVGEPTNHPTTGPISVYMDRTDPEPIIWNDIGVGKQRKHREKMQYVLCTHPGPNEIYIPEGSTCFRVHNISS